MTKILLVRHGESQANRLRVFAGSYDIDLEERGVQQAEKTARYIAEHFQVDAIYSSDLIRAYKTAEAIAQEVKLPITAVRELREISAGAWEAVPYGEIGDKFGDDFYIWQNDIGKARCTGGESAKELGDRVMAAITKIAEENDNKTVVIATHATPIRAMECMIETGSVEEMKNYSWVSNASVSILEYENRKWKIAQMGIDGHLADLRTVLPTTV